MPAAWLCMGRSLVAIPSGRLCCSFRAVKWSVRQIEGAFRPSLRDLIKFAAWFPAMNRWANIARSLRDERHQDLPDGPLSSVWLQQEQPVWRCAAAKRGGDEQRAVVLERERGGR